MRFSLENEVLTLFLEGELNSYNADGVEKDINATLEGKSFKSLILNFENLRYISSAGLRVILKLKQKYSDLSILDASLEVYDVLQMTGFTNIIQVKKALKRVYISGAEIIGEGFFSTVYRIDKDTIIKVFNRVSDPDQIERELRLAKEAFVLGIPTAISFDIVKVEDKLGVRFEMLDCMSLKNVYIANPDKRDEYIKKYADLLKKITTTECYNPSIPDIKKFYLEKVEAIKPFFKKEEHAKLSKLINSIPDRQTFVHGDCHFKNIMVQNGEFILIDMDTLSVGHPIFELAALYAPYCAFEEDEEGNTEKFFGINSLEAKNLYNSLVDLYFGKDDALIKDKLKVVAYTHMVWWASVNQPDNKNRLINCKNRLANLLDKYDDLDIGI